MRTLLFFIFAVVALIYYAQTSGLAAGYPPYVPVAYWNYSGDTVQSVRAVGNRAFVRVTVNGQLYEGTLQVTIANPAQRFSKTTSKIYRGPIQDSIQVPVEPGLYDITFKLIGAKGYIRYDWFSARNDF